MLERGVYRRNADALSRAKVVLKLKSLLEGNDLLRMQGSKVTESDMFLEHEDGFANALNG